MTLKDFKSGQTVYNLRIITGKSTEYSVTRYKVVSIGRKYVRATPDGSDICPTEFYLEDEDNEYLTENRDWGNRTLLFFTESNINDYIEKIELRKWFRNEISEHKLRTYTLNQLRAIKAILGGKLEEE